MVILMAQARATLISLQDTRYYHCISRCVRRAYLCGQDELSGQDFEHRRVWVIERLRLLSQVFAIDICAYAIMSNHYHLVLHVDVNKAQNWSNNDIVERWTRLYHMPESIRRWFNNPSASEIERRAALKVIDIWRQRLMDISWFMRNINEFIARKANKEDQCTGRFWEGRFKSQALLDEKSLLACMAYVDLNPVRAGLTDTLEHAEYTSIYERIHGKACAGDTGQGQTSTLARKTLYGFWGYQRLTNLNHSSSYDAIEYSLLDYIELVESLGHISHSEKTGCLRHNQPSLMQTLGFDDHQWQYFSARFGRYFCCAVGGVDQLRSYAKNTHRAWVRQCH